VETRALARRSPPRTLYAGALLGVLVAALLGAWFLSGWHDVRLRQVEVRNAPVRAANAKADEIARELRGELEALMAREVKRPYFHYQNLMHDPKASAGVSVSPSPLARGVEDALIAGYFQIDAKVSRRRRRSTTRSRSCRSPSIWRRTARFAIKSRAISSRN
jgi:hypothetical protein